jgi:hypothetical protein
LSYPEEPHPLAKEDNQKYFQIRMKQYFDHHLKDAAAIMDERRNSSFE